MDHIARTNTSLATSQSEAVVKPDGDLKTEWIKQGKNADWLQEGVDNTGMGVTVKDPNFKDLIGLPVSKAKAILLARGVEPSSVLSNLGLMGESSPFMSFLSQNIPGVRGASITHDSLVGMTERALGMEETWYGTAFTITSIPPAFLVQYSAYGVPSYNYYYKNIRRER
ncbi:hypothetical protein [Shewanella sp. Isolate7]|uniref:hypothetical protein n=1 Tax=Shewanella sp. Isolate7 TaxID=2908528 RepID=UPI001EFEEEDB|nr:hypothetical protein [Shewanella sp. Isolate7]MCG9723527.1 hypothetical protein [Shewanella sp. Isolate7]